MTHRIHVASTEYLRVPIASTVDGATVDITSDAVEVAVVASGTALAEADWADGTWETDTVNSVDTYYARLLITAGDFTEGWYRVYVRITDDPETPVVEATDMVEVYS